MTNHNKIIVLDPGHGLNKDRKYGRPIIDCRGGKLKIINNFNPSPLDGLQDVYREDIGTLQICKATKKVLECLGHTVYLTRNDNRSAALYLSEEMGGSSWKKQYWKSWKWIREYCEKVKSDIFVSIHTNAGGGTGCSAFWAVSSPGIELCEDITSEINKLKLKVRRIDKHRYLKLRNNSKGRAILLECLFHDNLQDLKLLLTQDGIDKMGRAIALGINNHTLR